MLLNLKAPIRRDGRAVLEADVDWPFACNKQVATDCPETLLSSTYPNTQCAGQHVPGIPLGHF